MEKMKSEAGSGRGRDVAACNAVEADERSVRTSRTTIRADLVRALFLGARNPGQLRSLVQDPGQIVRVGLPDHVRGLLDEVSAQDISQLCDMSVL